MKNKNLDWFILPLFLFLVVFLRLPSFFQSVLSNDESLYLLMASSLTDGQPPYTAIWDNKPIGIYILFYLALLILGDSVLSIRIIACIAVSITCYLLYRLGNVISLNDTKVGLLAGILYAILSLGGGGLAANTEIFYASFVVFAFYLLFSVGINPAKRISTRNLRLFIIGLLMGIGVQIKQVVIFEFIAIILILGIFLYFQTINSRRSLFTELFKCYVLLLVGLILPFLSTLLYFIFNGHFSDYYYANFAANLVRVSGESFSINNFVTGFVTQVKSNLLLWVCLFLTPFYWVSSKETAFEKRNLTYLLIWFSMAFLGVCSPKSFYAHYFLQLLPSLCLLSAYIIIKTVWAAREIGTTRRLAILALILITPLLSNVYPYLKVGIKSVYFQYIKGIDNWGDSPAIISKYLRERVAPQDYIYVADYVPIIYYLIPAKIPTKYAFTDFMTSPNLSKVAGIDPVQELHSIMERKPVYIIRVKPKEVKREKFYTELDRYIKKYYKFEKEFNVDGDIFEITKSDAYSVELHRLKNKTVD